MNWRDKYRPVFSSPRISLDSGIVKYSDLEAALSQEQAEAEERFYLLLHSGDKEYLAQQRIGWRL